jgi:hypothetical protein
MESIKPGFSRFPFALPAIHGQSIKPTQFEGTTFVEGIGPLEYPTVG